jgi:hypothetical protein
MSSPSKHEAVIEFLREALACGPVETSYLQISARAAQLLGERQQIQHAKGFKKAKKALGIRSIRSGFGSGGQWAWLMPRHNALKEVAAITNSELKTNEQDPIRDSELPDKWPAARAGCGTVQQWIEGVQRLDDMRYPAAVPVNRWHLFLGDCHRFLSSSESWAERAAALGWDALALFGCHRTRPLDHLGSAGLLWHVNGGRLVELHRDWAVIERARDKSQQVHHRRHPDESKVALPWALSSPA